jgi:hypothetical protein
MTNRIPLILALLAFTALPGAALIPTAPARRPARHRPASRLLARQRQGDYYIRQIGNEVVWVGLDSTTAGAGWTHMFRGYRNGNVINGAWRDVRGNTGNGHNEPGGHGHDHGPHQRDGSGFGGTRWSSAATDGQGREQCGRFQPSWRARRRWRSARPRAGGDRAGRCARSTG